MGHDETTQDDETHNFFQLTIHLIVAQTFLGHNLIGGRQFSHWPFHCVGTQQELRERLS